MTQIVAIIGNNNKQRDKERWRKFHLLRKERLSREARLRRGVEDHELRTQSEKAEIFKRGLLK